MGLMAVHGSDSIVNTGLIEGAIAQAAPEFLTLLKKTLAFKSISGSEAPLSQFIADWAKQIGLTTDLWEAKETDITAFIDPIPKHIPLAGRPVLVIRLSGKGHGKSMIFNAHADVVAADPACWTVDPWAGIQQEKRIYGRGACDAKGPLIGALWAMLVLRRLYPQGLDGDVLLELVPGEEDCVGLGTAASIARGYHADAAVVLEPTGIVPMPASRGGVRFEIVSKGKAVHGTAKWLGVDAIKITRKVLDALDQLEKQYNEQNADVLFSNYPIARPITVDKIQGGQWQGMVCDRCGCGGYFELLPNDDREAWKNKFKHDLETMIGSDNIEIQFSEEYAGHRTNPDNPFCHAIETAAKQSGRQLSWAGFNSGCESGLRANLQNTPTVVWGPGDLAQAHSADEFINFDDIQIFARMAAQLAVEWAV